MANAAGFIQESIWRDEHWRQLSRSAQALYMQLLSQKELDCAGVLPLQANKWAKGCRDLTVGQVWDDLDELQQERFVFYDVDTDEAFIRTYVRNSNVVKIPNMRKSARRAALLVGSERIRELLAVELRATEHPELVAVADEINPSGNPSPNGSPNGSKQGLPEPLPEPTGVGTGVGVTHLGSNSSGEEPPQCKSHPENPDKPCRKCKRRREWEEAQVSDELEQRRQYRALAFQAQLDCPHCDDAGWVKADDGGVAEPAMKCTLHHEAAHA